jgi:hypothetical protein
LWFGTWMTPLNLQLGTLYLRPEQKQFVRMNLGMFAATAARLTEVRYDPETEPLYPANVHTDLAPLVRGKDRVVWLRPQMC